MFYYYHKFIITTVLVCIINRFAIVDESNYVVFGFCPSTRFLGHRSRTNHLGRQSIEKLSRLQVQTPIDSIPKILQDEDYNIPGLTVNEDPLLLSMSSSTLIRDESNQKSINDFDLEEDINCVHSLSLETCSVSGRNVYDESTIVNDEEGTFSSQLDSFLDKNVMSSYLGPRIVLAMAALLYGTNCPLGALINDSIPPSAFTCARMVFASLTFFLVGSKKLHPSLIGPTLLAGCFTSLGYVTQSIALIDTSPATVSFLGALTVIVCPLLEFIVDKRPMGWKDAPQIWISSVLCLIGVGVLEFYDPNAAIDVASSVSQHQNILQSIGMGDILAIVQAFGFGTGIFLSSKMMRQFPDQSLPITSVMISTTAFWSMIWCMLDGWIGASDDWLSYTIPGMLFPSLSSPGYDRLIVLGGIIWTGVVSTSGNFYIENVALGRVPSAEASVYLGTEPLWAAVFASLLLGETFGTNDIYGGIFITIACLISTLQPKDLSRFFQSMNFQSEPDADTKNEQTV